MPRYFFDVRNDGAILINGDGIEVQNLQIAVREAAIALADMANDMTTGLVRPEMSIEIRDEQDRVVAEVRLNIDLKDRPFNA
jgi:hypothetical protein